MTNELVFPKIDGDILYASEVNRFARTEGFFKIGSGPTLSSGTAVQILGSVLISAGSVPNPIHLAISARINKGGDADFIRFGVSGTGGNDYVLTGSVAGAGADRIGFFVNAVLGSPLLGHWFAFRAQNEAAAGADVVTRSTFRLTNNFNTANNFIVFIAGSITGTTELESWSVSAGGVNL